MTDSNTVDDALLRKIFQLSVVGILVLDKDGVIFRANDAFLEMVGYTREELEAGKLSRALLTPPVWAESDRTAIAAVQRDGTVAMREKEYVCKDGSIVSILAGGGTLAGTDTLGFVIDISDRKRAVSDLAMLGRALDNTSDAVMRSDSTGHLVSWNLGAEKIFGWTAGRSSAFAPQKCSTRARSTARAWRTSRRAARTRSFAVKSVARVGAHTRVRQKRSRARVVAGR